MRPGGACPGLVLQAARLPRAVPGSRALGPVALPAEDGSQVRHWGANHPARPRCWRAGAGRLLSAEFFCKSLLTTSPVFSYMSFWSGYLQSKRKALGDRNLIRSSSATRTSVWQHDATSGDPLVTRAHL